jgi:hypothetical protein
MKKFANTITTDTNDRYVENILTPMTVSGVVVPWEKTINDKTQIEYKLACDNGTDYMILSRSEVENILPLYSWKSVNIVGLVNESKMLLIPQKILPKGPDGESSNVIDLSRWKKLGLRKKLMNKLNDFIIVPAAVLAVLAF